MEVLSAEHPEMGFLGMQLTWVPGFGLFVHQTPYIQGLLQRHQMEGCSPSKVIMDPEECLDQNEEVQLAQEKAEGNWSPELAATSAEGGR
jgi:hypothetical protein